MLTECPEPGDENWFWADNRGEYGPMHKAAAQEAARKFGNGSPAFHHA